MDIDEAPREDAAEMDKTMSQRLGLTRPSESTERAAAQQQNLRQRAAETTGLNEEEITTVDPTTGEIGLTESGRKSLARQQFQEQRRQARRESLKTGANADVPLGSYSSDELEYKPTDDETVTVSPTRDAAEEKLKERAARQDERFDESDIAVVGVGQEEKLVARVRPPAARREAREKLAQREGVDAEDIVVEQTEPGKFVAEEREGPPVDVNVNADAENLFARAAGEDADAPGSVDVDVDKSSRAGKVAAAGVAGVAAPEPSTSIAGGLVAGGAIGTALVADAVRRSNEVPIGEGVQRTELDVSEQTTSELEVGGSVGSTTEVEVSEPSVQEVEPGAAQDVTEIEVGEDAGATNGRQTADETVVPEEYPVPGRDFPANPRKDTIQRDNTPQDILDTGAAIDQPTTPGGLPSPGDTPEIEPTTVEQPTDGTGAVREFPTGSEAVVSEPQERLEQAQQSEVTSGEDTLTVAERAVDREIAGTACSSGWMTVVTAYRASVLYRGMTPSTVPTSIVMPSEI